MGTHHFAVSESDASDWLQAHAALSRLARERAAFDAEEGRWLLCAWRAAAHVHLGYGSFAQYIERLFGYKPRTTQEKLRVAEALETLPRLATALETGALGWCAARELTRVALPETESAWLDAARGKTLRELEALVASRAPGDTPDTAALAPPRRRVLRFEVAADMFATFREAMQRLRRCAGGSLDDDALLLAMARHILGGPRDEGRRSYQVALSVCSACGGGEQQADGERVPVDAAVVAMAACDAQHLGELVPRAPIQAANENAGLAAVSHSPDHAHVGAQSPGESASVSTSVEATDAVPERHAGATRRSQARAEPAREAKYPTGAAPSGAHARSTPLPRGGLHPRDVRRRASRTAARGRRAQRGIEPHDAVLCPPQSRPSR